MNESSKRRGNIAVIFSGASMALIAVVVGMAWQAGIADSKQVMAQGFCGLALVAGGGGAWFGVLGLRGDSKKSAAVAGLVLGGLCALISLMLLAASRG